MGLDAVFSTPEWPQREFAEVWLCVPTRAALLIPAELNRPEYYVRFFTALGYADDPETRILAHPAAEGVLLHGVCEAAWGPLAERFGKKLSFFHPLTVSLGEPPENGTTLYVDIAAGTINYTLNRGGKVLFADVLPSDDEASLLLAVSRIIVAGKVGALRIVCSGEGCEAAQAQLSKHYRDVSVHSDGENRNLFFPLR